MRGIRGRLIASLLAWPLLRGMALEYSLSLVDAAYIDFFQQPGFFPLDIVVVTVLIFRPSYASLSFSLVAAVLSHHQAGAEAGRKATAGWAQAGRERTTTIEERHPSISASSKGRAE